MNSAERTVLSSFVVFCLLCLCIAIAGCTPGLSEITTEDVSAPPLTVAPESTARETDAVTDTKASEITDELTTASPELTEITDTPEPLYAPVLVYGADGYVKTYSVVCGTALPTAALEAIELPTDTDTVRIQPRGWEYSVEPNGERREYSFDEPPIVGENGMHIYPVLDYSYLIRFSAGEGTFADGTETAFFAEAGRRLRLIELLKVMPIKPEDKLYSYPLMGFEADGKLYGTDEELFVNGPIELVAVFGRVELEYSVVAHTEHGALLEGGGTYVFKGNYHEAEAFIASYKAFSSEDIYSNNSVYRYRELYITREGREWTLELIWDEEILRYSVIFDHDDGKAPMISHVAADGKVILPICRERENEQRFFNFVGWRDDMGQLYDGGCEYIVSKDTSFKAEYIPGALKVYRVEFNTDIGAFENGSSRVILTGHYGDPLMPPEPPAEETLIIGEVVYSFGGWDREPSATFTENTSYTAVFTTERPVFYLSFYINEELWLRVPHYEGAVLVAPERPESVRGMIFSGWQGLPDTMPPQDVLINAEARRAEVIYILDGEVISRSFAEVGEIVTVAAPAQKHGHTVGGWQTTDIESMEAASFIMPERDVRFSAISTPKPHKVTYILDGITVYTDPVLFGEIYTVRGIEVKTGYDFSGWKPSDASLDTSEGIVSVPDNDIVFIGSLKKCSYHVNYYVDGILLYADNYAYGDKVELRPEEKMEGCSFAWSSAAVNIIPGYFHMPAHDVDVFGAFSDGDNSIIFMVDGKHYGTIGVTAGRDVSLSLMPTKNGYTFTGWSSDDIDITSGEFVMPEGDIILRGSFIPNAHVLSFIDIATGDIIGMSYLDYLSAFTLGDRAYCVPGRASIGWVLLEGDALFDGDRYVMPDSDVTFGVVWEDCLTFELEEDYWVPYYDLIADGYPGSRYDAETQTFYISDPSIGVAGETDGIRVVFEYAS